MTFLIKIKTGCLRQNAKTNYIINELNKMISSSIKSKRTSNPIRNIVDNLNPPKDHYLKLINLALGDPTLHGNLQCPQVLTNAVQECLLNHSAHGYLPSTGLLDAKKAISHYYSTDNYKISEDDIVIASGCSGTVELVLSALIDEGIYYLLLESLNS